MLESLGLNHAGTLNWRSNLSTYEELDIDFKRLTYLTKIFEIFAFDDNSYIDEILNTTKIKN